MKHTRATYAPALALILAFAAGAATGEEPAMPPTTDAPPVHAMHGRHHGPPDAETMTRHMQEDLGLSEEQTAKVRVLNEEQVERMKKLHPTEEEMRARMEEMEKIRREHDAALEKVLSPEQYATFRKSREEHAGHMHKRHHGQHLE